MKKQKGPHPFNTVPKDIKSGSVPPVILLCGEEDFLVDWAEKLFVETYTEEVSRMMDLVRIEGENPDTDEIINACETPAAMSEKKVVVVKNCAGVWGKATGDVKRMAEFVKELCDRGDNAGTMLIFTAKVPEGGRRSGDLFTAVSKNGKVYDFTPLSYGDAEKFAAKRFRQAGKEISQSAVAALITESGYDNKDVDYGLYNLENDIKKIIAATQGKTVKTENVIRCISENPEHGVFKMLDAISGGDKAKAMKLLHGLMLSGENSYRLLAIIVSQTELMLQMKEMKDDGMTLDSITGKLKVNRYRGEKAMKYASRYSSQKLKEMLAFALETDSIIKTGKLSDTMALEVLVSKM